MASHPVWDEWIEIFVHHCLCSLRLSLIPFGMSGLKYDIQLTKANGDVGLIPFGMSGLKFAVASVSGLRYGLIPFGMSGLKYIRYTSFVFVWNWSHPVWDEWIEIG